MTKVLRFTDLIAEGKVSGKRVFIRADLNVPQDDDGNITEDTRVRASVPAIKAALDAGAAVMVTSHLGRPTEGQFKPEDSLAPVAKRLSELLGRDVPLVADWVDGVQVQPGNVVLLENCRCNKGEKKNDDAPRAENGEALRHLRERRVRHRAPRRSHDARHREVRAGRVRGPAARRRTRRARQGARQPEASAGRDRRGLEGVDQAHHSQVARREGRSADRRRRHREYVHAGVGPKIGKSLAEADLVDEAKEIIEQARTRGASVPIPSDVVTAKEFAPTAKAEIKPVADVADDDLILDIGPDTAKALAAQLETAGTIVWNGPVGVFEFDQFGNGTKTLAQAIASSSAFSIAGGGDTLAAIAKYGIADKVSYISTGGGAFLEFLEGKTLPAVEVLESRA